MGHTMTRRDWLGLMAGVSLAACDTAGERPVAPEGLPNIVVVLIDDLAVDVMGGSTRYPFLQTPNLDRIRREGATFTNAFVTTSLCSPSRASLLTGLHAHVHGVLANDRGDLVGGVNTFPGLLQVLGYRTALIGKWHMNGARDDPRPGFDYWLSFKGQGVYFDPVFNENGQVLPAKGYITDLLTASAGKWIESVREHPFCLILSHKAGHAPFLPAERHREFFAGESLPEPSGFRDTFEGKPAWQRRLIRCGARLEGCATTPPPNLPVPDWQPAPTLLDHLRTFLAVDEGLGTLVNTLEQAGALDNTLLIVTSDNGFMLTSHRLGDKRVMYEQSIRIPLWIRYPPRIAPGSVVDGLTLNLDLAPTILELIRDQTGFSGQLDPRGSGRSLWPLLEGRVDAVRSAFLYEYFPEAVFPAYPMMLGVRTDRLKYVIYPEDPEGIAELYDLERDPDELHNRYLDPGYAAEREAMIAELNRVMAETGYRAPR